MTEGKLIIRNVRKNIQDYMIYFLTLTVSVSMFYAFNSIQTQPALGAIAPYRNGVKILDMELLKSLCAGGLAD